MLYKDTIMQLYTYLENINYIDDQFIMSLTSVGELINSGYTLQNFLNLWPAVDPFVDTFLTNSTLRNISNSNSFYINVNLGPLLDLILQDNIYSDAFFEYYRTRRFNSNLVPFSFRTPLSLRIPAANFTFGDTSSVSISIPVWSDSAVRDTSSIYNLKTEEGFHLINYILTHSLFKL